MKTTNLIALMATVALFAMPLQVWGQLDLVLVPNGDFEIADGDTWTEAGGGAVFSYPTTGGNSDGYGTIDSAAGWGVLVAEVVDGTAGIPLESLGGLTAGETYTFSFDMIDLADDTNMSGIKLEGWAGGSEVLPNSGDVLFDPTTSWETYTVEWTIPAGSTSVKFVPLSTLGGNVGFDNVGVLVEGTGGLLGDFDESGVVDCADLDGYVGNIGVAVTPALAPLDIDGNGTITAADANTHITTLVQTSNGQVGTFPGDLNCDGTVNVLGDAFALVSNLNNAVTSYSAGDLNFDGTVNVLGDAFALIGNLGNTNEP